MIDSETYCPVWTRRKCRGGGRFRLIATGGRHGPGNRSSRVRTPSSASSRHRRLTTRTGRHQPIAQPNVPRSRLHLKVSSALRGDTPWVDREVVHQELEEAREAFHRLIADATEADLRHRSNGTRWTNKQLLFHMLLGYLILRALRVLVRLFGRLPDGASRTYVRILNSATTPFDAVNYVGSRLGGTTLTTHRMEVMFDHVIAKLHHRLDAESDADLARGMHYPTRWDPFFTDYMTLADIYRFPTRHFHFHRRQLSFGSPRNLS